MSKKRHLGAVDTLTWRQAIINLNCQLRWHLLSARDAIFLFLLFPIDLVESHLRQIGLELYSLSLFPFLHIYTHTTACQMQEHIVIASNQLRHKHTVNRPFKSFSKSKAHRPPSQASLRILCLHLTRTGPTFPLVVLMVVLFSLFEA